MDELNADGALKFDVDGVAVELTKDDLLIDMAQKEGYVSQEDNKMTVVLDTNLTPELVEEGFVYEIISKIQTMRKESGFEVTDHIRVSIKQRRAVEIAEEQRRHQRKGSGRRTDKRCGICRIQGMEHQWRERSDRCGESIKFCNKMPE